jgi:hypothetical protein
VSYKNNKHGRNTSKLPIVFATLESVKNVERAIANGIWEMQYRLARKMNFTLLAVVSYWKMISLLKIMAPMMVPASMAKII